MKKITLSFLIVFTVIVASVFILRGKPVELSTSSNILTEDIAKNTAEILTKEEKPTTQVSTPPATPSNQEVKLKSPNIDINALKAKLSTPAPGAYNITEVSKHNIPSDCYLIINNNVYNVSSFIGSHPGGSKTITSRCGSEVTGIFAKIHSNRAWDLLKKYKIGTLSTTVATDTTAQVLTAISSALQSANPNTEVVKVSPQKDFYIAKVIANSKLYEVHISNTGKITKQEAETEELWNNWENDTDDNL